MATTPLSFDFEVPVRFETQRTLYSLSQATGNAFPHNSFSALEHIFSKARSLPAHCVDANTAEEFIQRPRQVLFQYTKLLQAISLIAEVEIAEKDFSAVACDSLNHLRDQFSRKGIVKSRSRPASLVLHFHPKANHAPSSPARRKLRGRGRPD